MNPAGWEKAQPVMMEGQRYGWRMQLHTKHRVDGSPYWTTLALWRGDEYLEINWLEPEGRLADTRRYRTQRRNTRSFTFAGARRIICTPAVMT